MKRDYFTESHASDRREERSGPDGASIRPMPRDADVLTGDPNSDIDDDFLRPIKDETLRQRVLQFLAGSQIPALRQVRVEIDGDSVVLRGELGTFYEKQMATQFASRVAGVIRVIDSIEVRGHVPLLQLPYTIGRRSEL